MTTRAPHFSIHASVVFQLGENLVTDATQAILELVKNSYDADASYCKLVIDTSFSGPRGVGQIVVEDDGTGMNSETLRKGWLTISDSSKKTFKRENRKTEKGRTPLGDKGLGRLGTQRLGNHLEIDTRTGNGIEYHLGIDWDEFASGALLEDVPLDLSEKKSPGPHGTKLTITGLRDLEVWKHKGQNQLRTDLTQIISPYVPVKRFEVIAVYNGETLDLFEFGDKLKNTALINYDFSFEESLLAVRGRIRLDYMKPSVKKDRELFEEIVRRDGGDAFFAFLKEDKAERKFDFVRDRGGWWVGFELKQALEDIDGVNLTSGKVDDPGPFKGVIDYFSLAPEAAASQTAFADAKTYRTLIQSLGGIRVYRDGFGIRLSQDWLGLGEQWTSGGSYYTLKPQNTVGYVAISALENHSLEEKTDREGFSDNGSYRNFALLLRTFIDYAGEAQEFLRRGWTAYKNRKALQDADVDPLSEPEDLSASLRLTLDRAPAYRLALSKVAESLSAVSADSAALLQAKTSGELDADSKVLAETSGRLTDAIRSARSVLPEIDLYLQEVTQADKVTHLLADQLEALRGQMRQMHEVIALGLTAEALSHELSAITSDMAHKNDQIIKYLRSSGPRDQRVLSYAEHIRSVTSSLRKELSYLAPSLQYVREKRDELNLVDLFNEMIKYHVAGYSAERISLRVQNSSTPFRVRANKGKLLQVFENLLQNAEYWLKEDIRTGRIGFGTINIQLQSPVVIVSDNGRGIDPKLEQSVFEPFISGKGRGKGRGLGLFIAQQLLASENCSLSLLPERNAHGRLWQFEVNLRGITHG